MAAENKPEGLKKIRNPDGMYRSAVCYAGHAPPKSISDDTEMNNEHGHLKIYLPKKLLECLPKCSSLPKERHRWNTNERHPSMQADIHPPYWFSSFLFILNLTSEP
uniref:calmodulin-binding transcription activator 1 isoform X2 n=1 Tax=Oncorhynchus gorbuscha TaxID=8017 RepID=UPI001EAE9589|nr:calmodulin-binding transcription activator 1 isoform X2 [Oncorhynchus gorbuscha]